MIASLMMYRRPQLEQAHTRYWRLIREHLLRVDVACPDTLSQDAEEFFVWTHPELVLSQTCGMPYRTQLHGKVTLVGTPDFGLADCPAGFYRSAIVVRADDVGTEMSDFKDATFAYNQTLSQSGYAAPFWHVRSAGFWFANRLHTGQHVGSARSVATGQADIAAIDAVTWRNIEIYEPFAKNLRVLEWTAPTPGLPLITALGNDADLIFDAVRAAIAELDSVAKSQLGLTGIVKIPAVDYLAVPNPV